MEISLLTKTALDKLREHRERHIVEYKEQFKGWQEAMQGHGDALKDWATNRSDEQQPTAPPRPTNYLKQYNEFIQKLEYHELETIVVEEYEFDQIINDKFNWTRGWFNNNAMYASASLTADRIDGHFAGGGRVTGSLLSASSVTGAKISALPEDHVEIE